MFTRTGRIATGVALLALAVSACTAGSSTNPGSTGGSTGGSGGGSAGSITIGLVAEPASLDFTTTDGAAIPQVLLTNVYETLVKQDQDGKIVPSLAKDWKVSEDRKTYTFDLQPDATFTNGDPFTAADAVASITAVKSTWTISLKAAMDVVADAKALSEHQLQVTLSKPSNDWLFRMTTRIGAMLDPKALSTIATQPVGTGPYAFAQWNRGDSIT